METILKRCSRDDGTIFTLDIPDVYGVKATLYVLNGGTWPLEPEVGDFAYDILTTTFQVRYPNGWRSVTVPDVKSLVWHPSVQGVIVSFTLSAIPFWRSVNRTNICKFDSIVSVFDHFLNKLDPTRLKCATISSAYTLANCDRERSLSEFETVFALRSCELIIVIQKENQVTGSKERMSSKETVSISVFTHYARLTFTTECLRLHGGPSSSNITNDSSFSVGLLVI